MSGATVAAPPADSPSSVPPDFARRRQSIDSFIAPLYVAEKTFYQLACKFAPVYRQLARTSHQQFLPTPVTRLPTGRETGRYLAIDVGGSNLRVAFIDLLGTAVDADDNDSAGGHARDAFAKARRQRARRSFERKWPIGNHLKQDKEQELFLWIGDCMAEVVAASLEPVLQRGGDMPEELEMGITFSFPMLQNSLSQAQLMPTGKGFAMRSDLDLGSTLLAGYERHTRRPFAANDEQPTAKRRRRFGLPRLKIAAITNDTVATFASLAYTVKSLPNSRVAMGLIVGTGCNATLPMNLNDLHPDKAQQVRQQCPDAVESIINTEWTINGGAELLAELGITTKWDRALDQACARPGFQPFEYITGGRYIGELVRLVLYDYVTTVLGLSRRDLPAHLVQEYALTTTYITHTVAATQLDHLLVDRLNETLPAPESSDWRWDRESARAFREIARAVQARSAGLVAAVVVGLLACKGELMLRPDDDGSEPSPPADTQFSESINLPKSATSSSTTTASISASTPPDHQQQPDGDRKGPIVPVFETAPAGWRSGPEELVVAYTGGVIQHYPHFKETCQRFIDRFVMWNGPQESGKSVFLREASDGGIVGAGVLAGTVSGVPPN